MRERDILDAAASLFAEKGFAAASIDEIGERAGVTGPAIYRHFRGKDEILTSLLDEALDGLLEVTVPTAEEPFARLEQIVSAHTAYVLRQRELSTVFRKEMRSLSAPSRRRIVRRAKLYLDRWCDALRACHPDRDETQIVAAVHAATALVNSTAEWPREARRMEHVEAFVTSMAITALSAAELRPAERKRAA